jgi:L-ascorbate metabolism protein UlaG (beta-lactamase superfamily)
LNINITYLEHSGFLLEWDTCYFLFDYYKGQIPSLDNKKMLVIYVSHGHKDHFNTEIFKLYYKHPKTSYLISSDIKLNEKARLKYEITEEIFEQIMIVNPCREYELKDEDNNSINISTLKSTDWGVAFLIRYKEKTVYHGGDLNLWLWKGEDKQFNNDMRARFHKEISKLDNIDIDLAFAPLDPRQEEWYSLGMNALLDIARIKYVFPMHFWDKPETVLKYIEEIASKKISTTIMNVREKGQRWSIEI